MLSEGCSVIRLEFNFKDQVVVSNAKHTYSQFIMVLTSSLVIVRVFYQFMRWFLLHNRYKNYLGTRVRKADR